MKSCRRLKSLGRAHCCRRVRSDDDRCDYLGLHALTPRMLSSMSFHGQSATKLDEVLRTKMDEVVRRCIREDGTVAGPCAPSATCLHAPLLDAICKDRLFPKLCGWRCRTWMLPDLQGLRFVHGRQRCDVRAGSIYLVCVCMKPFSGACTVPLCPGEQSSQPCCCCNRAAEAEPYWWSVSERRLTIGGRKEDG
jgi:hypothetical protein